LKSHLGAAFDVSGEKLAALFRQVNHDGARFEDGEVTQIGIDYCGDAAIGGDL